MRLAPEGWTDQAACATHPEPDLWFAWAGTRRERAQEVCRECPVRPQCLDYAVRTGQEYGVWGGVRFHAGIPRPKGRIAACWECEAQIVLVRSDQRFCGHNCQEKNAARRRRGGLRLLKLDSVAAQRRRGR